MKLRKSKKTVRVLSLILAVAMLMSAMMVQAFAINWSDKSESFCGYTLRSNIRIVSIENWKCSVYYDDRAIIDIALYGTFTDGNGNYTTITGYGGANYWEAFATVSPNSATIDNPYKAEAFVDVVRDGQTTRQIPTYNNY